MRKLLILLFVFLTALTYSQTNTTFNNLDVRNTSKFRGLIYPFGASAKSPLSTSDYVGMIEATTFKLLRVNFPEFADSITSYITIPVYTASNRNTLGWYSRQIGYDFQFRGVKTGNTFIDLLDSTTYIQFTLDTADLFNNLPASPQYWTFVDAATDTLKNNVATVGVVAIKGNLELQTTNAAATNGVIKQNGVNLMHTYYERSNNNLFIGQGAGNFTADSSFNTGIGVLSLSSLTTGFRNTSIGYNALINNTSGKESVAVGFNALKTSTTGFANTAVGASALETWNHANTAGGTVAIGVSALQYATTGDYNTATGAYTLMNTTIGKYNTALGYSALGSNIQGDDNVALGREALYSNGDNDGSVAVGKWAMYYADSRVTGERITYNTAIGYEAMRGTSTAANNTGQYNTATGYQALDGMTSASWNTVYGYNAGGGLTTGDSNILIGTSAGSQLTTQSDQLYIDNTNTTTPLIHGNMRTDYVTINGQFTTDNSFGELFEDAANVTATVATYKTIVSLQAGQYNEATLTDSSMTITQAGTYLVNYSSSFTHSVNNTLCHISLFVNDTEDTSLEAERKIGTAGDFGSMSGTALVTLTANAVLKLKAKSDNDGDLTVNHLNFNCTRIK